MFYYLATPYTKYPYGLEEAYALACRQVHYLRDYDIPVFSPITHSHGMTQYTAARNDDVDYWWELDLPFLDACCGVIICEGDSWEQSLGMRRELDYAKETGKSILYMRPYVGAIGIKSHYNSIRPTTGGLFPTSGEAKEML